MLKIKPVARQSLVDTVVQRIRTVIEQGHLRAGDRLPTEAELSAQLGVSRTVVREAVNQWRFGTNNDESDPCLAAECSHLRMIAYVRGSVRRDGKNAGIPRRAVKSFELRTLPQFPGQGMFAATAADKKHIHAYFLARKNGNGTETLMPS